MAYYLVRARFDPSRLAELRARLADGEIASMQPFGQALSASLEGARLDLERGEAVWEEECYCLIPLDEEREAVLGQYFTAIDVERIQAGEGWERIKPFPSLWPPLVTLQDGPVRDWQNGSCD